MKARRAWEPRTAERSAADHFVTQFAEDVQYSLLREPRQLPSSYLYDELGSALFEAICRLPWYPITRAEERLLARHGKEIFRYLTPTTIVELGSGSGQKLAMLLSAAALDSMSLHVHLVDLSPSALALSARTLSAFKELRITTHEATYETGLSEAARVFSASDRVLVLFLGSNLGNFDPLTAQTLLRRIRRELRAGDALLLGADLVKPERELQLAYDDPLGVTAAFNRNLLVRINRELGANFAVEQFAHRAVWNAVQSRVEMHLIATTDQHVDVPAAPMAFDMAAGELIWTESSYKYRDDEILRVLHTSGFQTAVQWVDPRDRFALTLAEAH